MAWRAHWVRAASLATIVSAIAASAGCVVEHDHPYYSGPTEIQFGQARNLGSTCPTVTSWTVTNRETGDSGSSECEPIIFTNLAPGASYTFDVTGYIGSRICWQGACGVSTIPGGIAYADCSAEIEHLCGF